MSSQGDTQTSKRFNSENTWLLLTRTVSIMWLVLGPVITVGLIQWVPWVTQQIIISEQFRSVGPRFTPSDASAMEKRYQDALMNSTLQLKAWHTEDLSRTLGDIRSETRSMQADLTRIKALLENNRVKDAHAP